jgi:hypothetical protein
MELTLARALLEIGFVESFVQSSVLASVVKKVRSEPSELGIRHQQGSVDDGVDVPAAEPHLFKAAAIAEPVMAPVILDYEFHSTGAHVIGHHVLAVTSLGPVWTRESTEYSLSHPVT